MITHIKKTSVKISSICVHAGYFKKIMKAIRIVIELEFAAIIKFGIMELILKRDFVGWVPNLFRPLDKEKPTILKYGSPQRVAIHGILATRSICEGRKAIF